jgi:hypothetical protein
VLASLFGTAFAVALPLVKVDGVAAVSLKLAVGFLMSLIAVSERGVKKSLQCFGLLLAFTFALGGALVGAQLLKTSEFCGINGTFVINSLPGSSGLSLILSALLMVAIASRLFGVCLKYRALKPFFRKVAVVKGVECVFLSGLIDTGNTLTDAFTGKPVCVVSVGVAKRLEACGVIGGGAKRKMRIATASGFGQIMLAEIDRLVIYSGTHRNIIDNAIIGIASDGVRGVDMLIHPSLTEGEK